MDMATTEQDTTPESPADRETKATTRTYIVLERAVSDDHVWQEVGSTEASTDQQAIAKLVRAEASGTWVAVAQRGWHPRTRTFDTPPPKPVWS